MLYQYGCCILKSSLEPALLDEWLQEMTHLPINELVERSPHDNTHWSYNGCSRLPHRYYERLEEVKPLQDFCDQVLDRGWKFRSRGGDLVKSWSPSCQKLHSDWNQYLTYSEELG